MGDVARDGLLRVRPIRRVPNSSSPYDDVHPQVPVCREWFPVLNLVSSFEPI